MNNGNQYFVPASEQSRQAVGEGIQRQMFGFGPSTMMVKATFEEGSTDYIHGDERAQARYVESGEFGASINGEIRRLTTGDAFYLPSNSPHGAVCKSADVLIDAFSPMRENFISADATT